MVVDILTGWPLFLSLAVATGSVVTRWVILPRHADADGPAAEIPGGPEVVAGYGGRAAAVLLVAMALFLVRQLVEFHDPFGSWAADARTLLGTAWGTTWMLGVGATVAALVGFRAARGGRRGGWAVATIALLALGAFPGLTGHADAGDLRALTLPADLLHVWAVGAWIGTLTIVLLLERRARRGGGHPAGVLPTLVPRFSPVAVASVSTLIATGVLAAWIHLGGLGALLGTRYGRLLLLKVVLVLVVLALGALNWRRLSPMLDEDAGGPALRRAATLEFVVANIVLIVTALLVRTSPM